MYYALYRQWGNGLLKKEESDSKIMVSSSLRNFVILRTENKNCFDEFLPRTMDYLAHNGISIINNAINENLWR